MQYLRLNYTIILVLALNPLINKVFASGAKLPVVALKGAATDISANTNPLPTPAPPVLKSPISPSPSIVKTLDGNIVKANINQTCTIKSTIDFMDQFTRDIGKIYPENCAISGTNPPIIQWPEDYHVDTSVPWTITIKKAGITIVSGTNIFPHYQVSSPLALGDYDWSVSFKNTYGNIITSDIRHFSITNASTPITVVSPSMVVNASKLRAHPRYLPLSVPKETIISRQIQGINSPYAHLLTRASDILNQPSTPQPVMKYLADFATQLAYQQWLNSLNGIAGQEADSISILGYVSSLTNDSAMRDAGIQRLLAMANWDPNGATSYAFQDQANRQVMLGLAKGYDYFYDYLTPSQRLTIMASIKNRTQQMISILQSIHLYKSDSHHLTIISYLINSLLLVSGDPNFPEAENYLRDAFNTFLSTSTAFGGDDGAFQNGNGYGWYVETLIETIVAIKSVSGYDLMTTPYFAKYADYLMAFTPPVMGELMLPFGDDHTYKDAFASYSTYSLQTLALLTGSPTQQWYYSINPNNPYDINQSARRPIFYFNTVAMGKTAVAPIAPVQNTWFFPNAGIASLHSQTSNLKRSSVSFRSSKFGSLNHSYADQNSFVLVSKGKDMLISSGYYPWFGSPHHANVTRSTRYQNALTFDGGIGQAESTPTPTIPTAPLGQTSGASGLLYNGDDVNNIAVVTGDATLAYRGQVAFNPSWTPFLTNAIRSIAYFRNENITVVYDWATSNTARKWELNYHALKPFSLLAGNVAKVTNDTSSICITHYNFPSTLKTTDVFDIAPENSSPDQYHLRATANSASTSLSSITVIREDCSTLPVTVSVIGTKAQVMIGLKGVEFDKKIVSILQK